MSSSVNILWLGHSCFRLETNGFAVVLDPFEDGSVPGLPNIRETAQEVLCSHEHFDHNYRQAVKLAPIGTPNPFTTTVIETFHDDVNGSKRGPNRIHVLEAGGLRIAHLGDLGHPLSPEQAAVIGQVDALLIPVGGFYTIDAVQAKAIVDQVKPRVTIPMHYSGSGFGFDNIGPVEDFVKLCQNVQVYPNNSFDLTKETPAQVAVLQPPH